MSKIILNKVQDNSYFCSGILSVGVYASDNAAIIIDSSGDESSAKHIMLAIQNAGFTPSAIINTHCHPDHCGGNAFFQKHDSSIKIYATYNEKLFIEDPDLAPRCFCSLAAPFSGLCNKYIAPQKRSQVTHVLDPYEDQVITINNADFKIITLPGHTPGMIGIISPDNVLYCGDALFGQETLKKHPILFYTDIKNTLLSFDKLALSQVDACVLYHGGIIHNIAELAALHKTTILATKDAIYDFIQSQTMSIDQLTQRVMQAYNIPETLVAYTLTQTAIKAYVTYLESEKNVQLEIREGLLQIKAL